MYSGSFIYCKHETLHGSKPVRISRNGPYRLERLVVIDLLRLDKNGSINGVQNDKKRYGLKVKMIKRGGKPPFLTVLYQI